MRRTRHVGLTGGIGSGKSTVAAMLINCGATVIDSDQIAREVTEPHGAAIEGIRSAFGEDFIQADGALDRTRMRALAFQDPEAKQRLEGIVHPWVSRIGQQRAAEAEGRGCPLLVFDVPLLVESGRWARRMDAVVVVDCPPETQLARVMARNGLAPDAVQAIIASQASPQLRRQSADLVLFNGACTSIADLETAVRETARLFGL